MSETKCLEDIESEIGRSLALLNDDLDKMEEEMRIEATKTVRKPEEYRKTLEVLDNVLAEFDDWATMDSEDTDLNNENSSLELEVFLDADNCNNRCSPDFQKNLPVIPIRSPTTRLSESDNNKFLSPKSLSPTKNDCTFDVAKLTATSVVVRDSNMSSSATEYNEERIQQLRAKFQRVRELLKKNVIKLLDVDPPSFIPPTPPHLHKSLSLSCEMRFSESDDSSICSRQSPTVEDIPNLLPTDLLIRPQFGMTYSLEEDLPPGVKEIHRTSTPKSDFSASSFSREFGRLSAFSSQSELEVSSIPDKVPLTSFKSLTLPNGLDRFPFYSHEESYSQWKKPSSSSQRSATTDLTKNSEDERKTKKSHFSFRKFNRKSKSGSVL